VLSSKRAAAQTGLVFVRHECTDDIHVRGLSRCSITCARSGAPSGAGPTPRTYNEFMTNFHELEMTSITGEQVNFDQYKGNLVLVVNVASA
jgi:hypothetical protein